MTYSELCTLWAEAKESERAAIEKRRGVEDELLKMLSINQAFEGTENFELDGYKIKVVGRFARKVDSEALQELAAEAGLTEHLSSLFRWKPEIDAKAWKSADVSITTPLMGAITTTPSRASFTITKE